MDTSWKQKNSWLQQNAVVVAIVLLFLLIVAVIIFSYLLIDLKSDKFSDKLNQIGKAGTDSSLPPESAQKIDSPKTLTGPKVEITTNDPVVKDIINRAFKHVFLPSGDVQVQTIKNVDELKKINPIFFEFAKNGDHVLLYKDRAILYDPVADLVLDIVHIADK